MSDWNALTRMHVLAALAEGERIGAKEFQVRYGFRGEHSSMLWHRGEEFDATAVLGVAHVQATGRAVTKGELPPGQEGVAEVLIPLGFDVVAEDKPVAPTRARTTAAPRRAARPEPALKICPTCQMALPATGICDNCD